MKLRFTAPHEKRNSPASVTMYKPGAEIVVRKDVALKLIGQSVAVQIDNEGKVIETDLQAELETGGGDDPETNENEET